MEEYVDPDYDGNTKYNWDDEFQRMILSLLFNDKIFLTQSIDLIKPHYFPNKAHSFLCSFLFKYFSKYRILPRAEFTKQDIKEKFKDNDKLKLHYVTEFDSLIKYYNPGLDSREYLLDKVTTFAKIQSIRIAFSKVTELLAQNPENEETWEKAYSIIRDSMNVSKNFDIGLEYFKDFDTRYERLKALSETGERFVTGFTSIDEGLRGGGLGRGEIGSFVAASGGGKSLALACATVANVKRGKKVLYITLELSEDKNSERLDAIFTGEPILLLQDRKKDVFEELNSIVSDFDDKNLLVIKSFPAGEADTNTFRAYIAQLKFYGFTPDMIIVDYVGEMKVASNTPLHEAREKNVRELRALASEESVCILTAMQPNRLASKDKKENKETLMDETHLADSFGQIRPLDACWSINVSEIEHSLNVGTIFVIKHRDGKTKYRFYIEFDRNNLRINEISIDKYKEIRSTHKDKSIKEVDIDNVVMDADTQLNKKKWKPSNTNVSE